MNVDKKFIIGIILATIALLFGAVMLMGKTESPESSKTASIPVNDAKKKLLDIASDDWIKGNKEATVTLVEYLDFECEACGAYYPLMKQLSEEFKTDVRFVNRYFPLPGHKNGMNAALAVEAASKQGKYWEMHNLLFENQKTWGEKQISDSSLFEGYAQQLGLNLEQFKKDVSSKEVKARVERDKASGQQLGVSGTPSFFLDGEKLQNPRTPDDFKTLLKAAILKAPKSSEQVLGEKVHEHADFALYVDGKRVLLQDRPEYFEKDPDIHSHENTEEIIHKHKTGVTLGQLIDSWKTNLPSEVSWSVNGKKQTDNWRIYEFNDLDRIIMSFSVMATNIPDQQLSEVTDRACVYSETCPERGTPPTEKCVGGLGTDC